jgi:hypothetical protein
VVRVFEQPAVNSDQHSDLIALLRSNHTALSVQKNTNSQAAHIARDDHQMPRGIIRGGGFFLYRNRRGEVHLWACIIPLR